MILQEAPTTHWDVWVYIQADALRQIGGGWNLVQAGYDNTDDALGDLAERIKTQRGVIGGGVLPAGHHPGQTY